MHIEMDALKPPSPASKLIVFARRTASTLFLWVTVSVIFASRWSWAYLGLIGLLVLIGTIEYFRMLRGAGVKCFPRFGIIMALAYCGILHGFFLSGHSAPYWLDSLAIFIAILGSFTLQLKYQVRGVESLLAVAANVTGFAYIVILFNFTARVIFLFPTESANPGTIGIHGSFLLLWLIAVTKFTDMGAYITGSIFGRHKMISHVSPGKTWEGFVGAVIFAQLAAFGLYFAFPQEYSFFTSKIHIAILGLILCLLAVIGDLAESVIKRALDAKDSGRMLPGIGGSLDLIDSICFTAPALYFYMKWFILRGA